MNEVSKIVTPTKKAKEDVKMGKCSICGNKIEYNQYKVIDEKVYCPKCSKKSRRKNIS